MSIAIVYFPAKLGSKIDTFLALVWTKGKERKGTLFKCLVVLALERYLGTL